MENTTALKVDNFELQLSPETSFEMACESVKSKIDQGRVLTEIYIGNKSLSLEDEEKISQIPIGRLEQITFVSKSIDALLRESSEMAVHLCDSLEVECQEIREIFESGDLPLAHDRIGELSALVGWLLNVMSGLQSHGEASFFDLEIQGQPVKEAVRGLEKALEKLHLALEKEDYSAFQNELQAGFMDEIRVWKEIFSKVSNHWSPQSVSSDS
ncbi:MAG: hypothetical protein ACO3LE_04105 [Bdellovibrionota bacterium]